MLIHLNAADISREFKYCDPDYYLEHMAPYDAAAGATNMSVILLKRSKISEHLQSRCFEAWEDIITAANPPALIPFRSSSHADAGITKGDSRGTRKRHELVSR